MTACDGTDPTVVANTICNIPAAMLNAEPFNIPWGTNVYLKLYATNIKGDSLISNEVSETIIYRGADKPVNVVEDLSLRTISTLGFSWVAGVESGGTPIIDYRITVTTTGDPYIFKSYLTLLEFEAVSLTRGILYVWRIQARTAYGIGEFSDEFPLLCAIAPETPEAPSNYITGGAVVVEWPSVVTNGAPITDYQIFVRQSGSTIYTQEAVECAGTTATIIENRSCEIAMTTLIASPWYL